MTARRTAPILRDETERDKGGKEQRADPKPRQSFAGTIKNLFQQAKKLLTNPAPAPQPSRKRRTDDTKGAFMLAARRIVTNARQIFQTFRHLGDRVTGQHKAALPRTNRDKAGFRSFNLVRSHLDAGNFVWDDFVAGDEEEHRRLMQSDDHDQTGQQGSQAFHYGEQNHLSPEL